MDQEERDNGSKEVRRKTKKGIEVNVSSRLSNSWTEKTDWWQRQRKDLSLWLKGFGKRSDGLMDAGGAAFCWAGVWKGTDGWNRQRKEPSL